MLYSFKHTYSAGLPESGLRNAIAATAVTFETADLTQIRAKDIIAAFEGTRLVRLRMDEAVGKPLVALAKEIGLVPSKCECNS